jgi:hypothetical protein
MADTSLIIGNGNWAVKENSLLGYNIIQGKYVPIEMNVSRATTGTRVKSGGLIELVPKNLFSQSQTFDITASWYNTGLNSTVIPNVLATSAPNGTFTADKLVATAVLGDHFILQTSTTTFSLAQVTVSVFAKKAELSNIQFFNNAGGGGTGNFDLNAGQHTGPGTSIQPYPDDWYRCIMTYTISPSVPNFNVHIKLANSPGVTSFTGNGVDGVYLWGAQLEQGTTATEYFPTTDRFNIPRIDYSTSTTGSLLVEPARTNSVLYSADFDNVSWIKSGAGTGTVPAVTSNADISPSGSMDADKIDLACPTTGSSNWSWVYQSFNATSGLSYTFTVYLKAATPSDVGKIIRFGYTSYNNITLTADWKRYTNTAVAPSTASYSSGFRLRGTETTDTTASFFAYGAQLEAGANATSYIPTTTLAAGLTRAADVISKTGISNLIGQTEGTLFVEFNNTLMTYNTSYLIRIFADASNEVWIRKEGTSNTYTARWKANGTDVYTQQNIPVTNGNNKIAFAYKSGDSAVYLNGNEIVTPTPTGPLTGAFSAALSQIGIGSSGTAEVFDDRIKSVTLFKTRLSNPQLGPLTT